MGKIYTKAEHEKVFGNKEKSNTLILDSIGTNLNKEAEEGKLEPVIGRDEEIKRATQILGRKKKNNPVLIGHPGVGKTSIVEGIAVKIVEGNVPLVLQDKKIYTIEISSLIAGTKYRGEFEEKMKALLEELKKSPNIIVFIDELHTIVGAGMAGGSLDVSNIFKPALARGEIQCIGATTYNEYRNEIEGDGALDRRFQKIKVHEPSIEDTFNILKNIKNQYESYHFVRYSDEIIESIINLSNRYITDRYFPDKAIDIMDEVGSFKRIETLKIPQYIKVLEEYYNIEEKAKYEAVKQQKYLEAATYRNNCEDLKLEIEDEYSKWREEQKTNLEDITQDDINKTISKVSGIPIEKIGEHENERLLEINNKLKEVIIGQDHAIDKIASSIKRNRVGIRKDSGTIGNFIFLGPSGVGKTALTKAINSYLFGSDDSLIRVDMSEYSESHTVSKLIGSPPGYVGHEEGGQLTEKVRQKPYSVILFDEIEKAHSKIFNTLLQLLDDGYLTDSLGRKVDFRNCLIILTSNEGSRKLQDFGSGIGFGNSKNNTQYQHSSLENSLKKKFPPEFLNRIDDVIIFNKLDKEVIKKILNKELQILKDNLKDIGNYDVKITESAKSILIEEGFNDSYGARHLNRAIQNLIENPVSDLILSNEIKEGDLIKIGSHNKKIKIKL